ncbi:hypothetical protein H1220_02290 [Carnobacteriaceae bacterium zg-84]|nr:hypothetical protein H1220_02290 [Carnobacteriaceae bacterium zg-84]
MKKRKRKQSKRCDFYTNTVDTDGDGFPDVEEKEKEAIQTMRLLHQTQ